MPQINYRQTTEQNSCSLIVAGQRLWQRCPGLSCCSAAIQWKNLVYFFCPAWSLDFWPGTESDPITYGSCWPGLMAGLPHADFCGHEKIWILTFSNIYTVTRRLVQTPNIWNPLLRVHSTRWIWLHWLGPLIDWQPWTNILDRQTDGQPAATGHIIPLFMDCNRT